MPATSYAAYAFSWALSIFVLVGVANDAKDVFRAQAGIPLPKCATFSLVRPVCR